MTKRFGGLILETAFRVLVPFTLVYGIYVLHTAVYSPGGGFQAGALLAVGVVLARLIQGRDAKFNVTGEHAVVLAGFGTFIYAFTGFLPNVFRRQFLGLQLSAGDGGMDELHALGILMIEIGVTICVMMTIIDILDVVTERADIDD